MNEDQDIPEENFENKNSNSEDSNETVSQGRNIEPSTSNTDQQTSNIEPKSEIMEVHKHPHHVLDKKKWVEYFLEFLMIFVAVTLGFFAENIREKISEREKEAEYMNGMVQDLKNDIILLDNQIEWHKANTLIMDSLIEALNNSSTVIVNSNDLYFWGRIASRNSLLINNDRTFEQMKNSGGFRLIKNQEVSNKIITYYNLVQQIHYLEGRDEEEQNEYVKIAVKIFNSSVFNAITKDTIIERPTTNPKFLSRDPTLWIELSGYAQYMKSTRVTVMNREEKLKGKAKKLMTYLEDEFHFE